MGPTGETRVVQIHPTRRCNLRCRHCYSASSPEARGALEVDLLKRVVDWAAAEGYAAISLSGGEPLLYEPMRELFAHARAQGLATALTTNGMLLDARRIERLRGVTDLVAISLDGAPETHNEMRAHPRAFETMESRLADLRASGLRFGFLFTLTQHNLHELESVAQFALAQGAGLLQIHPLEITGRALDGLAERRPDGIEATMAYLEALRLRAELGERLRVQVDVVNRQALAAEPDRVYAGSQEPGPRFADVVSPLVVEDDGTLVPLQYGFDRRFALGRLGEAALDDLAQAWRRDRWPEFRAECRGVFERAVAGEGPPCFNWYEAVARAAGAGYGVRTTSSRFGRRIGRKLS